MYTPVNKKCTGQWKQHMHFLHNQRRSEYVSAIGQFLLLGGWITLLPSLTFSKVILEVLGQKLLHTEECWGPRRRYKLFKTIKFEASVFSVS